MDYQPELEDTANAYVMLAKNASMTGQALQIGEYFKKYCRLQELILSDAGFAVI